MDTRHVDGELKDVVDPVTHTTPRALLQVIGTDLLQHGLGAKFPSIGRRIFASAAVERILACDCNVVVTDLRFEHERLALAAMVDRRVQVVKIVRIDADHVSRDHESEAGIPDCLCDEVILNDGSLHRLHEKAHHFSKSVQNK
jgi:hypothetical protein